MRGQRAKGRELYDQRRDSHLAAKGVKTLRFPNEVAVHDPRQILEAISGHAATFVKPRQRRSSVAA